MVKKIKSFFPWRSNPWKKQPIFTAPVGENSALALTTCTDANKLTASATEEPASGDGIPLEAESKGEPPFIQGTLPPI